MTRYRQRELNSYMAECEKLTTENKALVEKFGGSLKADSPRKIIERQLELLTEAEESAKISRERIFNLNKQVEELQAEVNKLQSAMNSVKEAVASPEVA